MASFWNDMGQLQLNDTKKHMRWFGWVELLGKYLNLTQPLSLMTREKGIGIHRI